MDYTIRGAAGTLDSNVTWAANRVKACGNAAGHRIHGLPRNEFESGRGEKSMQALLMNDADNVLLVVADLPAGASVTAGAAVIAASEDIPSGHKFARRAIAAGELIVKYGQPIGRATADIAPGAHVHVHNVESLRGRGDLDGHSTDFAALSARGPANDPHFGSHTAVTASGAASFMGYRRKDGRVGVRNHVMVLSAVQCANGVVRRIAQLAPEVVPVTHVYGCGQLGDDHQQTQRVLEEFAQHPNVGAVLLVGLGCETLPTTAIGERLAHGGRCFSG
jgi:altronate hydrolase